MKCKNGLHDIEQVGTVRWRKDRTCFACWSASQARYRANKRKRCVRVNLWIDPQLLKAWSSKYGTDHSKMFSRIMRAGLAAEPIQRPAE